MFQMIVSCWGCAAAHAKCSAHIRVVPFSLCSSLTASDSTPLSLSRCTNVPKDSSVFFATSQSCGKANACPLIPNSRQLMLQLHLKANNCMPSADDTDSIKQKLQKKLVSEINQRCGCGLSTRQIKSERCRLCVFFKCLRLACKIQVFSCGCVSGLFAGPSWLFG